MEGSTTPIEVTFPEAYEQLKAITERLNGADDIPPDELLDLLKRGKGLERVLRAHLDEVEQQVSSIEAGESYVAYRIVGSNSAPDNGHVNAGESNGSSFAASPPGVSDDDIPF